MASLQQQEFLKRPYMAGPHSSCERRDEREVTEGWKENKSSPVHGAGPAMLRRRADWHNGEEQLEVAGLTRSSVAMGAPCPSEQIERERDERLEGERYS
ncbi:hypothetical protein ZWY2020_035857 [Hordeum vulgare]|nr:hypothetical protein ZWY2020_035857 [Hordeum vulgare]